MVVMVAITIILPQLSGLATYTKNPDYIEKQKEKKKTELKSSSSQNSGNQYTYEAPDAELDGDELTSTNTSSRFNGVRSALNKITHPHLTEKDIPIKLELVGENELKRRVHSNKDNSKGKVLTADPNNFDYDLDEFIDEENRKDQIENQEEAQKKYGLADV